MSAVAWSNIAATEDTNQECGSMAQSNAEINGWSANVVEVSEGEICLTICRTLADGSTLEQGRIQVELILAWTLPVSYCPECGAQYNKWGFSIESGCWHKATLRRPVSDMVR